MCALRSGEISRTPEFAVVSWCFSPHCNALRGFSVVGANFWRSEQLSAWSSNRFGTLIGVSVALASLLDWSIRGFVCSGLQCAKAPRLVDLAAYLSLYPEEKQALLICSGSLRRSFGGFCREDLRRGGIVPCLEVTPWFSRLLGCAISWENGFVVFSLSSLSPFTFKHHP